MVGSRENLPFDPWLGRKRPHLSSTNRFPLWSLTPPCSGPTYVAELTAEAVNSTFQKEGSFLSCPLFSETSELTPSNGLQSVRDTAEWITKATNSYEVLPTPTPLDNEAS